MSSDLQPQIQTEAPAEQVFYWELSPGNSIEIPKRVHHALSTIYRGQQYGDDALFLLSHFDDVPIYVRTFDTEITCKNNVRSKLICKYDPKVGLGLKNGVSVGQLNPTKVLPAFFKSENISDEIKFSVFQRNGASAAAIIWKSEFDKTLKRNHSDMVGSDAQEEAEEEIEAISDPAEARDKARQKTLLEMSWLDKLRPLELPILLFYLAMFFYACRIPFEVLDNYHFRRFIKAVRPSFYEQLPHSKVMRTTLLDQVYEETIVLDVTVN